MKRAFALLCIVAVYAVAPTVVCAEVLYGQSSLTLLVEDTLGSAVAQWSYDFPEITAIYNACEHPSVSPPFTFKLENIHCELQPSSTALAVIFRNIPLVANVGKTFWYSSANDSQIFAAFVNHLTNPIPGSTSVWAKIGFADSKNSYFVNEGCGVYLSDGVGAEISRIGIRVDSAAFTPNVPEPSTAACMVCGVGIFGAFLLRRLSA
ncbi:MAG: hypothetical protein ABFD49_01940 [Armatimonadota bacterium]|nr:hypothetical protein [bacterium]